MTEEERIMQMAANVRSNTLKEAAKAVCPFCRPGNPWSDAACVDGMIYEHYQVEDPTNKRPCAAGEIWKLVDAK